MATPSTMVGLTLTRTQLSDMDVEGLSVKIDKSFCDAKEAILEHVLGLKARLLSAQTQAIDEERQLGASQVSAKQEEITLLKAELELALHRCVKQADLNRRLATAYDDCKAGRRGLQLLLHSFYAWRELTQLRALRRARQQRAEVWYSQVHLKRNVLRHWFRVARQLHRLTVHNKLLADVEAARTHFAAHFQGEVDALRQQLRESHAMLVRESEARERLEENMKQAFMRGVCALNIEAMSIMKRGMPPGGTNPIPLTVQPGGGGSSGADGLGSNSGGGSLRFSRGCSGNANGAGSTAMPAPQQHMGRTPPGPPAQGSAATQPSPGQPELHPGSQEQQRGQQEQQQQEQQQQQQQQQAAPTVSLGYAVDVVLDVRGSLDERGLIDLRGSMSLSPPRPQQRTSAADGTAAGSGSSGSSAPAGQAVGMAPMAAAVGPGVGAPAGTNSTAASYYQRQPRVTVTRGPAAEPPRPRPLVPLPTVRQIGSAR